MQQLQGKEDTNHQLFEIRRRVYNSFFECMLINLFLIFSFFGFLLSGILWTPIYETLFENSIRSVPIYARVFSFKWMFFSNSFKENYPI